MAFLHEILIISCLNEIYIYYALIYERISGCERKRLLLLRSTTWSYHHANWYYVDLIGKHNAYWFNFNCSHIKFTWQNSYWYNFNCSNFNITGHDAYWFNFNFSHIKVTGNDAYWFNFNCSHTKVTRNAYYQSLTLF